MLACVSKMSRDNNHATGCARANVRRWKKLKIKSFCYQHFIVLFCASIVGGANFWNRSNRTRIISGAFLAFGWRNSQSYYVCLGCIVLKTKCSIAKKIFTEKTEFVVNNDRIVLFDFLFMRWCRTVMPNCWNEKNIGWTDRCHTIWALSNIAHITTHRIDSKCHFRCSIREITGEKETIKWENKSDSWLSIGQEWTKSCENRVARGIELNSGKWRPYGNDRWFADDWQWRMLSKMRYRWVHWQWDGSHSFRIDIHIFNISDGPV